MLFGYDFALLVGLPAVALIQFFVWRRKCSYSYLLVSSLFSLYMLLLVMAVLFPISIYPRQIGPHFVEEFLSRINLSPFKHIAWYSLNSLLYFDLPNILMTIPFGFGLPIIARIKPRTFLWIPLAVGLGTELSQLLISLAIRYPYRAVDVNDTILNALGVLMGYLLFRVVARLYLGILDEMSIQTSGFFRYVEVTLREHLAVRAEFPAARQSPEA